MDKDGNFLFENIGQSNGKRKPQMVAHLSVPADAADPVKLDDLAIFKGSITSDPALNVEKFDIGTHIKNVRLCAIATGIMSAKQMTASGQLTYSTMAEKIKAGEATLSLEKGKYLVSDEGGGSNDDDEPGVVNP